MSFGGSWIRIGPSPPWWVKQVDGRWLHRRNLCLPTKNGSSGPARAAEPRKLGFKVLSRRTKYGRANGAFVPDDFGGPPWHELASTVLQRSLGLRSGQSVIIETWTHTLRAAEILSVEARPPVSVR